MKNKKIPLVVASLLVGVLTTPQFTTAELLIVPISKGEGNALAFDVLEGTTFSNANGINIEGTMTDNGAVNIMPSPGNQNIPEGYHNGFGQVLGDGDLHPGNILSGVNIFGVTGTVTSSGDAISEDILLNKKAWVNGVEVTGSIPTNSMSSDSATVAAGYYKATTLDAVDTDLISDNIKSGMTIFGVAGDTNVVDTVSGDAIAGDLLLDKKAWVAGAEVTGSMPTNTLSENSATVAAGYYADTTLNTVDTDLTAGNIRSGATIFGIAGDSNVVNTVSGDAVAGDLLLDKNAWVDGIKVTGSMPTNTLSENSTAVPAGYYVETTLDAVDTDLTVANIRKGTTIFGISGDSNVVNTGSGNAGAEDIRLDKIAWIDGVEVIGSMPTNILSPDSSNVEGYYESTTMDAVDTDLVPGNIRSGVAIFGIIGDSNVVNTGSGDAIEGDLLLDKTAWVDGAEVIGTIPTNTLSADSTAVAAGYYATDTTLDAVDPDLTADHIKYGVTMFGVTGTLQVAGSVAKTGETRCTWDNNGTWEWDYNCTQITRPLGQDGELQNGTNLLSSDRFVDNGDGTVTDNLTGLIWLKDANCITFFNGDSTGVNYRLWSDSLYAANQLAHGSCELLDNSAAGDWRLPNINELHSLLNFDFSDPALSNNAGINQWVNGNVDSAFSNVQSKNYWSSSTYAGAAHLGRTVDFFSGNNRLEDKTTSTTPNYVWPVRGGQ
ncbi:MAG: DUF1566 domain-containing protein [Candidatus Electrothrix sp. AR3]|nr:DUF1566 domain-containing protein [Candidatus Electrothrix sp. AR3]